MKYNIMSELLKEKVKIIVFLEETRNKTYKNIPGQIDNHHQHKRNTVT